MLISQDVSCISPPTPIDDMPSTVYKTPSYQDDVLAGWLVGALSAASAVRWVVFPEAFWRGGAGDDRFGRGSMNSNVRSLRHSGALALMMGSPHGSLDGGSSSSGGDGEGDVERGAVISGGKP